MNSAIVVWVLMANTHGPSFIPTIEFSSEAKCNQAIVTITTELEKQHTFLFDKRLRATCVRIEK